MITCELHEPTGLAEAAQLLAQFPGRARLLAGGTDLLVDLKSARTTAGHLVSLARIESLRGIENRSGLRLGAMTTIAQIERSPLVRGPFAALRDAARLMASPQVRHLATIGGNIASAVPCADLPPVLGVLDALVVLWSPHGERTAALAEFFTGPRQTIRREDEVLIAILVPQPPPRFGAAYERFALREGNSIAVASVAASLTLDEGGAMRAARLMLGAVAPIPLPVRVVEEALRGRRLEETLDEAAEIAADAARPISDVRGSAAFRRRLVRVLTRRALLAAHQRARESSHD